MNDTHNTEQPKAVTDFDFDSCLKVYYIERDYFHRREFSFTLKGDQYSRYRSYADPESFGKDIKKEVPYKIDIGAVYNVPPRDKLSYGSGAFGAKEKELVFDIDMSDYNSIRKCCTGTAICNSCWPWMTIAIKVIDKILRDDFGFNHLLWVFSGRRGVHCWVCDTRARRLSAEARESIANYLSVIHGGEGKSRQVQLGQTLHPTLMKMYEQILLPWFEKHIITEQGLLDDEVSQSKILAAIPDLTVRSNIMEQWQAKQLSPLEKWAVIASFVKGFIKDKKNQADINPLYDIVFTHTYPRLDVNVSTGLNHLLKSPFCVHPATGAICVPIDPAYCEEFLPKEVPHVEQLIQEIDHFKDQPSDGKKLKDYKKTSLKDHVTYFKKSFLEPLQSAIKREQLNNQAKIEDTSMAF